MAAVVGDLRKGDANGGKDGEGKTSPAFREKQGKRKGTRLKEGKTLEGMGSWKEIQNPRRSGEEIEGKGGVKLSLRK